VLWKNVVWQVEFPPDSGTSQTRRWKCKLS